MIFRSGNMRNFLKKLINKFFRIFIVKENKIVFESGRNLVDGNCKAVYDYMVEHNYDNYKLVWLVKKGTNVSGLRKKDYAYYKTFKALYHLSTAKYWIRSQSIGSILDKRDNQVYIQLFHGNGVMKKMGYDVENVDISDRKEADHVKEWDYYIANDSHDRDVIISSTGYKGKIEVLGMAAVDNVIKHHKDKEFKRKVRNELGIVEVDKKIILYAPTFRDFDFDNDIIDVPIESLSKLKDYIVVVRLHPLVREKINKKIFDYPNIVNGCNYPDCSDILAVTDVLISDYSSIIYEYMPLNLPIIFYPYDYDKYVSLRGGFSVDYLNELPGKIVYNEEELLDTIENIDKVTKEYKTKREKFTKKYNYLSDGKASERFIKKLEKGYFK